MIVSFGKNMFSNSNKNNIYLVHDVIKVTCEIYMCIYVNSFINYMQVCLKGPYPQEICIV